MATIIRTPSVKPSFYNKIQPLFGGPVSIKQKEGIDAILAEWEERSLPDLKWLAYILATAFHETGKRMQPIEEDMRYSAQGLANTWPRRYSIDPRRTPKVPNQLAKKLARNPVAIANNCYAGRMGNGNEQSGDGWKYRGRGLPQTTGKTNYAWAAKLTGIDLVNIPDLMCQLPVSVETMYEGMINGMYTGKKLSQYFRPGIVNWAGARAIINGTDKAVMIGSYGKAFYDALI